MANVLEELGRRTMEAIELREKIQVVLNVLNCVKLGTVKIENVEVDVLGLKMQVNPPKGIEAPPLAAPET